MSSITILFHNLLKISKITHTINVIFRILPVFYYCGISFPIRNQNSRFLPHFSASGSAAAITCTKETGKYDNFLARCKETNPLSTGTGMQKMGVANTAEQVLFC